MTDDTEPPTKNTLFLALTRPALWAGIPIEAAVLLLISSASVLIWSNSPVYAALVVAFGYSISRLIVRHDVNAFRLLFLWGRTKLGNRNRAFWGGSSYPPVCFAGQSRCCRLRRLRLWHGVRALKALLPFRSGLVMG